VWEIDKGEYKELIEPRINIIEKKLNISKNLLEKIVISPFVKFVGVSGSVASEFVKEEDDIDLFIVVKNDTVWIYRFLLYVKNLSEDNIRAKGNSDVKDKLCINYLVEERGLEFEPDIFNLNELIYLKPLYNNQYLYVIYLVNDWLKDRYLISDKFLSKDKLKVGDLRDIKKRSYFLIPLNFLAFILQLIFMIVTKHNPDLKRLFNGFKEGKVEFYPKDFREEKLKNFRSR
jgi:hypothetical protein